MAKTSHHNKAGAGSVAARAAQKQLKGAKTKKDFEDAAQTALMAQAQAEFSAAEALDALDYEKEKHSPFKNWAQINLDYAQLYKLMKLGSKPNGGHAVEIFFFMLKNCDTTNVIQCSYTVLSEQLNMNKGTVSKAIRLLLDEGIIQAFKTGQTTNYVLNKFVVWKGYGKYHDSCKFNATVIPSEAEKKEIERLNRKKYRWTTGPRLEGANKDE